MSNHHRGTVLILLALCGSVFGQDFKKVIINNITSNRIKSIAQDSLGFLWIGTDEGLNRYDGLENQQYKSNVFDEKTLSSNRIKDIYIDNQNRVWVVGDRGVDLYNRKKNNGQMLVIKGRSKETAILKRSVSLYYYTRIFIFQPIEYFT